MTGPLACSEPIQPGGCRIVSSVSSEATARRPDALAAFTLARRWFKAGRRIEMQELAAELDVSRATLFRWVGGRNELLAEVLWSLAEPTLAAVVARTPGGGGRRIATIFGGFAAELNAASYFRTFLRRDPERALRILTTQAGSVQMRVMGAVEKLLAEETDAGRLVPPLPLPDTAYILVRILESFVYADLITGATPDAAKVEQATAALLGA